MTRPLRIEYPGACYHVINRGNRCEKIFFGEYDYKLFLEKLSEFSELYDVVIHCYCLMSNHFHIMLTTRYANLSRFMQSFSTSFTISMNKRYNKPGHLFQGRYKAQIVESKLYKNELSRYIHLNPVKIKQYENLSFPILKKHLHDYKWSSFHYYIGIRKKPDWLNRNFVLSNWGNQVLEKMYNYRKFVEAGLLTDNFHKIKPNQYSIIGSDSFRDKIIKKFLMKNILDIDKREQPVLLKANEFSFDSVVNTVADYFKHKSVEKISRKQYFNSIARKVSMYLSGKYCRKKLSVTSLAGKFGIGISGFNMSNYRFAIELKSSKELHTDVSNIESMLRSIKSEHK